MNVDLVIFDCDGVLVDSELLSNQSDLDLLESLGIKLELEEYMRLYVGKSALDTMAGIESQTGVKLPEDFLTRKQARVLERFERSLEPIPGIASVLEQLSYSRCVASSSTPERILFSLSKTGLLEHFQPHTIFSATMVKNGKPAPDLFLLAAREMKVSPARCIVIEDSLSGVLGAVAAGMTAFGFIGGSHIRAGHTERLLQAGATRVFTDMTALPALIGST
jgi:HAD superfamily hydrolase (TIGR01509 family)